MALAEDKKTTRIVLLGKTGSGKSSLANTLFEEKDVFEVNHSANSGTKICESRIKTIEGKSVQLIDTPGFFDTDPHSTELSPQLLKCIVECAPGPHAFVLVLKIDKHTLLEQAVLALMLRYFSKEVLKFTTVVFTYGDNLPEKMTIKEWVEENEDLKNLVMKCGGRCHVIDNKYWNNTSPENYRSNKHQIKQLLETIDQTVRDNGGEYYSNDMLKQVDAKIQKQVALLKRSSQNAPPLSSGNATLAGLLQKAKEIVLKIMKGIGLMIGELLRAFIGGVAVVVVFGDPCFWSVVTEAVVVGVPGAWAGRAVGRAIANAQMSERFVKDVDELLSHLQKVRIQNAL